MPPPTPRQAWPRPGRKAYVLWDMVVEEERVLVKELEPLWAYASYIGRPLDLP